MTFMGHDPKAGNTIIVGTNLTASPVSGEGSALILAKAILRELYGASAVPGASPSQNPSTTTTSAAGARAGTGTGTAGGGTLPTSLIQASPDQLELLRQLIAADGSGIHRLRYGLTAPGFDNGNLAAGLGTPPVAIAASPEEQSFIRQVFDRLAQVIRLQAVQDNQLSSPLQIVSVERVRDDDGLSDEITGITYTGFSFQVEPSGQRTVIPAESGITIEAELNDDPGLSAAEQRTIVHEIGHALGLEHPGGNPNDPNFNDRDTIMSYRLGGSEPATWFSPTDLQALTEIWGAASVVPPAPAPGPAPAPEAEVFRIDAITGTAIPGFRSGSDQLAIAAGCWRPGAPLQGGERQQQEAPEGLCLQGQPGVLAAGRRPLPQRQRQGQGLGDGGLLADLDPFTPLQASDIALA